MHGIKSASINKLDKIAIEKLEKEGKEISLERSKKMIENHNSSKLD